MTEGLTLCSQCGKVRFKIGVPVFEDWVLADGGPRVCTKKCAKAARKVYKQDAADEEAELRMIDSYISRGLCPVCGEASGSHRC